MLVALGHYFYILVFILVFVLQGVAVMPRAMHVNLTDNDGRSESMPYTQDQKTF
jgi:hypothetical protein